MSRLGDSYRLSQATQFVYERGTWVVYDGADTARFSLEPAELDECLRATAGGKTDDSETLRRLTASGVLVCGGEDPAPYNRLSWASRGWSAAYDFAVSLHRSADPITAARQIDGTAPFGVPRGIVEHYPPAPTAPPLRRDMLLAYVREARPCDAPDPVEVFVAAISVDGMTPGWYRWDGADWQEAAALPSAAELERIAPVAFGRAEYVVEALVIVAAVHPNLEMLGSRAYARLLVMGGSILSRLEGAASDAGLSCRGNYAVDGSVGEQPGTASDGLLLIGAVALGSR